MENIFIDEGVSFFFFRASDIPLLPVWRFPDGKSDRNAVGTSAGKSNGKSDGKCYPMMRHICSFRHERSFSVQHKARETTSALEVSAAIINGLPTVFLFGWGISECISRCMHERAFSFGISTRAFVDVDTHWTVTRFLCVSL